MATWTIDATGPVSFGGPGPVDRVLFRPVGPAPDRMTGILDVDDALGSPSGALTLRVGGSAASDTLVLALPGGFAGGTIDASVVTFASWTEGTDQLILQGTQGDDTLIGSAGSDLFTPGGGFSIGNDSVAGGAGVDTLAASFLESSDVVVTAGGTSLAHAGGSVRWTGIERLHLELSQGDDSVAGLAGADRLSGDRGDDTLRGAAGADALSGDAGDDALYGGEGDDSLAGGDGNDGLHGGDGADRLDGFFGRDVLFGGAGNDVLDGRFDADTLFGGAGDDTLVLDHAGDRAWGGRGTDTVRSATTFTIVPDSGIENVVLTGTVASSSAGAYGDDGANRLVGDRGSNRIRGGLGADTISVGGDEGSDVLVFRSAAESTGAGRDRVVGFDADSEDRLEMGPAVGSLRGASGGRLSLATFDADLAAAVDAALDAGGRVEAVLLNPSSGDLDAPGRRFLVVDLDNDGSYRHGRDLVIEMQGLQGSLGATDFV